MIAGESTSMAATGGKDGENGRQKGPVCISVINMKGGVGKTTVAALLGAYASALRLKVLLVDLDPQANLTQAIMGDGYRQFLLDRSPSVVEVFNGHRAPSTAVASPTAIEAHDVVFSSTGFGSSMLDIIPSRFDFSEVLVEATRPDPKILARVISDWFMDKDVILIDCAPTESVLTRAAYHASRHVLAPVKPEFFATIGFPLLADSLRMFRSRNLGHKIEVAGVVINNSTYHYAVDRGGPKRRRSIE